MNGECDNCLLLSVSSRICSSFWRSRDYSEYGFAMKPL